jgi:hypothetical protein
MECDHSTRRPGSSSRRVRFSLGRLMPVVLALGLTFGVMPWPSCGVMAVAIALPLLPIRATLIEWLVVYCIAGVLAGLLTPAICTHCYPRRIATRPATPTVATEPGDDAVTTDSCADGFSGGSSPEEVSGR